MNDLNLEAFGLTELNSEEQQNTNGGFMIPRSNFPQVSEKKKNKVNKDRIIDHENH